MYCPSRPAVVLWSQPVQQPFPRVTTALPSMGRPALGGAVLFLPLGLTHQPLPVMLHSTPLASSSSPLTPLACVGTCCFACIHATGWHVCVCVCPHLAWHAARCPHLLAGGVSCMQRSACRNQHRLMCWRWHMCCTTRQRAGLVASARSRGPGTSSSSRCGPVYEAASPMLLPIPAAVTVGSPCAVCIIVWVLL